MGEANGFLPYPKGFSTIAIHASQDPEQWESMAVVTPITTSTIYKQYGPDEFKQFEYSRAGNPTRAVLEKVLAALENGKYGSCFASGLGAVTTMLGLLEKGQHIVCINDVYGGTNKLFSKVGSKFGFEVTYVENVVEEFEKAIKSNTKMIWIETPTNPTLKMCDIAAISKISKKHNLILVVDNTFLTPYLQRPLTLGADIVVHSLTKYMNGHSDVVMGAAITNDKDLHAKIAYLQSAMGSVPSPFDCYQVLRSLKTLELRMKKQSENALEIAKWLEKHKKIEKVIHPGLPSHPQHELAKRQTSGHSGMVAIYIKGDLSSSKKFLKSLKIFTLAGSLGGYESLASLPIIMSHSSVPPDQRKILNITDNLMRLSVGLEDVEDLIKDLDNALSLI